MVPLRTLLALLLAPGYLLAACREPAAKRPTYTEASVHKPVDRLAPNELAQSDTEVFGFPVPRGMKVESVFQDSAYLIGDATPEAVANYVRLRVEVSHVEIGAARTIFPKARIKSGAPDRLYQLEVMPQRLATRLVIRDVTPQKPVPGMTEEERWRKAGMTPQGQPLDLKKLE